MKLIRKIILVNSLFLSGISIAANGVGPMGGDIGAIGGDIGDATDVMKEIKDDLVNLGIFMGYDIETKTPPKIRNSLLSINKIIHHQFWAAYQILATNIVSRQVSTNVTNEKFYNTSSNQFFKKNTPIYKYIKDLFSPTTNNSNDTSKPYTYNALIDQLPAQQDPVSQSILNIISTPDSGCYDHISEFKEPMKKNCTERNQEDISLNIFAGTALGASADLSKKTLSAENLYYHDKKLVKQLNGNTLIGPLVYSISKKSDPENGLGKGDVSQFEAAINYIRYATEAVTSFPQADFTKMKKMAASSPTVVTKYLATLRSYAAMMSVGTSNLYYILSKRMPMTIKGSSTSQALNEYEMATRRLNTEYKEKDSPWNVAINSASAATVQKEIAILLAEMNYQLYLNRQQEERMLLTQTIILIQSAKNNQPNPLLEPKRPSE